MGCVVSDQRFSHFAARAVFDARISDNDLRVLAALGTYTDAQGWCFPKQETIAERIGKTRPTVSGSIKKLVAAGYVEVKNKTVRGRGRVGLRYRVICDLPDEHGPAVKHFADVRLANMRRGAADVSLADVGGTSGPMSPGGNIGIEEQSQSTIPNKKEALARIPFPEIWDLTQDDLSAGAAVGLTAAQVQAVSESHAAWVRANLADESRTLAGWRLLFHEFLRRAKPRRTRAAASAPNATAALPTGPEWWVFMARRLSAHNADEWSSWWAPCTPVGHFTVRAASGLASERCKKLAEALTHPAHALTIVAP